MNRLRADVELRREHVLTRAQFLEGVRTLARRAQPNDVVLVFFSGHGNVQPVAQGDASELDGLDETIILFDGPVTDNDLASELSQIHAENVILALDTCHSGGFADDWVRHLTDNVLNGAHCRPRCPRRGASGGTLPHGPASR